MMMMMMMMRRMKLPTMSQNTESNCFPNSNYQPQLSKKMQILIMFIVKKKIVQEDLALFNRNYLQPYRRAPNIQICRVQT